MRIGRLPVGRAGREHFVEDDQQREDRHPQQPQPRDVDDVEVVLADALVLLGLLRVEKETRG